MTIIRVVAVALTALLLRLPVYATTIVLALSPQVIVIGSDSLGLRLTMVDGRLNRTGEETIQKYIVVQDRIFVASVGSGGVDTDQIHYDFLAFMRELEKHLPKEVSVRELAVRIQNESSTALNGVDAAIKSGVISSENPMAPCEALTDFIVAGFEDGRPQVFEVSYTADWEHKELTGPKFRLLDGGFVPILHFSSFGVKESIGAMNDKKSYVYQQIMAFCPKSFTGFNVGADTNADDMSCIVRALITVEETVSPNLVGGDIKLMAVQLNGKSAEVISNRRKGQKATSAVP